MNPLYESAVSSETHNIAIVNYAITDDDASNREYSIANAHLIAAAPDLLEACKAILTFLTGDEYHEYYYQAEVRQLRAAIAKAQGCNQEN